MLAKLQAALYVLADHIELEVNLAAKGYLFNIGMLIRIGDHRDGELIFRHVEYGEADTVEADRAFFDNEGSKGRGKAETEFPAAVAVYFADTFGGGVHMTLHDMAIEAALEGEASFEVDEVAGLPGAEIGLFQGLGDGRYAVAITYYFFHSKTNAAVRHALIDLQFA